MHLEQVGQDRDNVFARQVAGHLQGLARVLVHHRQRTSTGHLPKDEQAKVKTAFGAAMKLEADGGKQKHERLAVWLEREHPSAAASLREGLDELFTINRLDMPPQLSKCLATTNLIESTHSGVQQKTARITHWKNGAMVLRWSAAAYLATQTNHRSIVGHEHLWILNAHLDKKETVSEMSTAS